MKKLSVRKRYFIFPAVVIVLFAIKGANYTSNNGVKAASVIDFLHLKLYHETEFGNTEFLNNIEEFDEAVISMEYLNENRMVVLKDEEEARIRAEEEARIKAEEEAKRKAEEEARIKAEEEARRQEEARRLEEFNKLPLEAKIKVTIGDLTDQVGLVYFDLNSGQSVVINGSRTFTAASTVKVPMNMVLFDLVVQGKVKLDEKLQYTEDNYEDGTGILQDQDLSNPIPIKTLSDYSIIYSDNIATNMIINRIGFYDMKAAFQKKLGHPIEPEGNNITPLDAAAFLKILYQNPEKNPYYPSLIDVMKRTEFHDRIDRDIPENLVAHKIGNYGSYVNDIGIIFTRNPYILAVYTEDLDEDGNDLIAKLSRVIYEHQIKK